MSALAELDVFVAPQVSPGHDHPALAECGQLLRRAFGTAFSLWDAHSGTLRSPSHDQPGGNDPFRGQLARAIRGIEPQFIADEDSVLLLAIPLALSPKLEVVATAAFVVRPVAPHEHLNGAATLLGLDPARAMAWITQQPIWTPEALLRLASAVQGQIQAEVRCQELTREVEQLSANLAATYEEICLLHGLTQRLRIDSDEEQLCGMVLQWLCDCLPVEGAAVQLLPVAKEGEITYKARTRSVLRTAGACPLTNESFTALIEHLQLEAGCGPVVINPPVTQAPDWPCPYVRELIVTPLAEGSRILGWLALVNHRNGGEFGSVEASLLHSIGAILGIHASNHDLYRQQSEFLASVVRAMTSAIDAKDPYTCGHSDRVARIAVRLAKELGCDAEMLHTIYMAGLLHDIGKIGIDDAVLRKPDRLTPEEIDHIKRHPEMGYRILADIQQLSSVLPAVLHHHEQWDGRGYPMGLAGEQIPFIARVVAVADAYDAMSSDRPYRRGMPLEKVEAIFRAGAGQQWDAEVIAAYFRVRDDVRRIAQEERANLTLDVQQWVI
jgi:putative nucleotidyltransferase with HDIG domain